MARLKAAPELAFGPMDPTVSVARRPPITVLKADLRLKPPTSQDLLFSNRPTSSRTLRQQGQSAWLAYAIHLPALDARMFRTDKWHW